MKSSRGASPMKAVNTWSRRTPTWLARVTYSQPLERDFRPFHLPDQRGVGQRVEEREGLEIDPVGVAREEQRVRLDRVEHRRRRALRDVDVDGAQVLGEDRRGRSVVGADVLEDRAVAGLLGMMVDDEVRAVEQRRRSSAAARRRWRSARSPAATRP